MVGVVNIRYEFMDKLFNSGGYIGYGICLDECWNYYGLQIFELSFVKVWEFGIIKVLVVCDVYNIVFKKVIFCNGGVQD